MFLRIGLFLCLQTSAFAEGFTPVRTEFVSPCVRQLDRDSVQFFQTFKAKILSFEAEVKRRVLAEFAKDDPKGYFLSLSSRTEQRILQEKTCGISTKHLRAILNENQIPSLQYITVRLKVHHPVMDHTFLVAEVGNESVIVDPTYKQFFADFSFDLRFGSIPNWNHEQHPEFDLKLLYPAEDILVLPYAQLDQFIESLLEAKTSFFNAYTRFAPNGLALPYFYTYRASNAEFRAYMKEVWDFKSPIFAVKK